MCELASNPNQFYFKFHRQILSYWDRLPPELQQMIQWIADRQYAHDRLKRGWDKIHCQGFKAICQFCQIPLQPRDDSVRVWDNLAQRHCEECNVCSDCLIYYDHSTVRLFALGLGFYRHTLGLGLEETMGARVYLIKGVFRSNRRRWRKKMAQEGACVTKLII